MNKNLKLRIVSVIFILLILCLTFTLLQGYYPVFRRQWIFLVSICVIGVFSISSYFSSRAFFFLFLYFLIVCLNEYSGDVFWGGRFQAIYELSLLLAPSLLMWYAIKTRDERFMKVTLIVFFSIVVFETIASYIVNLSFPEVIRVICGDFDNQNSINAYSYYRLGVANYDIVHALPSLAPLLVLAIKDNRRDLRKAIPIFVLLLFTLFLVFLSYSTTSLILAIIGLIISLFTRSGSFKHNAILFVIAFFFLFLFINDSVFIGLLNYISGFIDQGTSLYSKLIDIKESVLYGESSGDVLSRMERYEQSISLFLANPLFGTNFRVGGHSSLFDRLATLGMVGFIPYCLFLYNQLALGKRFVKPAHFVYYVEAVSISLIMLALKDSDSWELFFMTFTLIPFISYFLSKSSYYERK